MKLDLHNHTSASRDSLTKTETLVRTAARLGLVVAVTDHDSCASWERIKLLGKAARQRVIFGEEILTTANGKPAGELMGLFMNEFVAPADYMTVIDKIKSQGALLAVPHPFDSMRRNFLRIDEILKRIDLFEVYNARCSFQKANSLALEFAKLHNITGCAGSDSHSRAEIGNAYVELDTDDLETARKLLLKGKGEIHGKPAGLIPHIKTKLAKYGVLKPA